jgi:hypothetical protein
MANKKTDTLTQAVPVQEKKPEEVRVRIKLPMREEDSSPGLNVDLYEHVTISNEMGENTVYVKRGEWVDVTIPVFDQLRKRYPDI